MTSNFPLIAFFLAQRAPKLDDILNLKITLSTVTTVYTAVDTLKGKFTFVSIRLISFSPIACLLDYYFVFPINSAFIIFKLLR